MKKCIICGKELKDTEGNICESCWDKLRNKKEVKEKPVESRVKTSETEKLLLNLEKLEGKLELVENFRPQVNERLSRLSEEIGDLRRMVLDRERSQKEMEQNIDKFKEIMEQISPEKFSLKQEKLFKELEKANARIERNETLFSEVEKELKNVRSSFSKIKSFENLVDVSEKIKENVSGIENTKRYVDRLASKVENIFSEVRDKTAELEKNLGTIAKVDELTQELVKEQDKLRLRFDEEVLKEKDLAEVKKKLEKEIKEIKPEELPKEFVNKMNDLSSSVKSLEKSNLEREKEVGGVKKSLETLKNDLNSLNQLFSKKIEEKFSFLEEKIENTTKDIEEKLEKVSMDFMGVEELLKEKNNVISLLKKAREDYESQAISEKAYRELERANKNRLENINSILKRLDKEMLYKSMKSLEGQVENLSKKLENVANESELEEISIQIEKIKEALGGLRGIKTQQEPIKESISIISDRLSNFEKEYSKIKEHLRDLSVKSRKIEDLEITEDTFHKNLENYKALLKEKDSALNTLENKLSNLSGKLFLLEKGQQELKDWLVELKNNNEKIEHSLKEITKTKADVDEIRELSTFFENTMRKNTEVVESLLEKIGV